MLFAASRRCASSRNADALAAVSLSDGFFPTPQEMRMKVVIGKSTFF
jgi:hypothetical protein